MSQKKSALKIETAIRKSAQSSLSAMKSIKYHTEVIPRLRKEANLKLKKESKKIRGNEDT